MNRKGFTLIELIAVIILIGLVATLASIPINNALNESREKLYEKQKNQIIMAANNWVVDNPYLLPPYIDGSSVHMTIGQLLDSGYLESKVIDSRSKKEISSCSYVEITLDTSKLDATKNIYKYQFYEVDDCSV